MPVHTTTRMFNRSLCTLLARSSPRWQRNEKFTLTSVVGAAIIIGSMLGTAAIAGGTAANVQEEGKMIFICHHRVTLPSSAKATVVATYLGMGVKDEGPAEWGRIESSLQGRAERL